MITSPASVDQIKYSLVNGVAAHSHVVPVPAMPGSGLLAPKNSSYKSVDTSWYVCQRQLAMDKLTRYT